MNQTTYEKGFEKGFKIGEIKGHLAVVSEYLEERFGPIPAAINERLNQMSLQELIDLGKAVVRAKSLAELGLEK